MKFVYIGHALHSNLSQRGDVILTIGKSYDILIEEYRDFNDLPPTRSISFIGDNNKEYLLNESEFKNEFISLSDYREIQLSKLL
jgi:hypothetical protein